MYNPHFSGPLIVADAGHISFNFRLEILFLIPYLLKMRKIKPEWLKTKGLI